MLRGVCACVCVHISHANSAALHYNITSNFNLYCENEASDKAIIQLSAFIMKLIIGDNTKSCNNMKYSTRDVA